MKLISECEEEVLLVVFELGSDEAALQQINKLVNKKFKHEWMPQTVSTFLARLVKKNLLTMERRGRYWYYTPTMSLDAYREQCMRERIEILFAGDKDAFKKCLKNLELMKE